MDDRRFDNVVRSLARHRSRRGLVAGLLGGGVALLASRLRLPGAAARHRHVAQGEYCVDADQCDPGLDCAWNGFGSAGAACCAYVGGGCADDFGCCNTASCFGGVCTDLTTAPAPGEPCQPGGNACVYASGAFYCDYVAWTNDYRCCAYAGDRCGGNEQCCGSNSCVGGVCASQSSSCTSEGCPCYQGMNDPNPCDPGLVCCLETDTSGTCLTQYACTGYGVPGDACPQYCLPGPTQCPGCISGYCSASGLCG